MFESGKPFKPSLIFAGKSPGTQSVTKKKVLEHGQVGQTLLEFSISTTILQANAFITNNQFYPSLLF